MPGVGLVVGDGDSVATAVGVAVWTGEFDDSGPIVGLSVGKAGVGCIVVAGVVG